MPYRRRVLLLQLPIPPAGLVPVHGNIPLAAGSLTLLARRRGLESDYQIELFPTPVVNTRGDQGLVEELLARQPWLVGFSCYVWNIDRTLWIAARLKQRRPDLRIVLGGPEITSDNTWVREHGPADYLVFGEGEQTFAELLAALASSPHREQPIPGLGLGSGAASPRLPLDDLNELSSPYLDGILDVAEEGTLFLETVRGCAFRCRFCYYPKSYPDLRFVAPERVRANLRHAAERGAREVVLLDPTLNQRPDFPAFVRLLADGNPGRQFTFFGELRAEGIDPAAARLLQAANFTEVEVGLQSVDRRTQELMGRPVNLRALERGVRALAQEGIRVKLDLILGLPGDTPDSVRRGLDFLHRLPPGCMAQVFPLSLLPGTSFRQQAAELGLTWQPRPPYHVLSTPTLSLEQLVTLMEEAQAALGTEFDPWPPPVTALPEAADGQSRGCRIDLDAGPTALPPPDRRAQAFVLCFRSAAFARRTPAAAELIARVLADNPHTTLQVTLEPVACPEQLTAPTLEPLLAACYGSTSYLDRYYTLQPAELLGAKRLVVLVPGAERDRLGPQWRRVVARYATLVWRHAPGPEDQLEDFEHAAPP